MLNKNNCPFIAIHNGEDATEEAIQLYNERFKEMALNVATTHLVGPGKVSFYIDEDHFVELLLQEATQNA